MGKSITIGIIGDFNTNSFSHIATNQAIQHAATHLALKVKVDWLPTPSFMTSTVKSIIDKYDGLIASPGSPYQSMDGAIKGIQTAREMNFPFIGT